MKTDKITIGLQFKKRKSSNSHGILFYTVRLGQTLIKIKSTHIITENDWNKSTSFIANEKHLTTIRIRIRQEMKILLKLSQELQDNEKHLNCITEIFSERIARLSLTAFTKELTSSLKNRGKWRRCETYMSALRSILNFNKGNDIMLYEITPTLMEEYQSYLQSKKLTLNTISFYTRQIRAIYNKAVKQRLTEQTYPFADVYTGRAETRKRAICKEDILRIRNLHLGKRPALSFARDMFILSFCLRGMSFIDMAYLRKSDITDGFLTYRRRKTGQLLRIKWESVMQEIIKKHPSENDFLLPIIKDTENERKQYKNASKSINRCLKKIAAMTGLNINLTMYVSRHSWASIAKQKNIPISIISEGLGHDSELTTRIYLATLDHTPLDNANKAIISGL